MGAGGAVPPPAGYFPRVQAILNRHGIPFVADEVVTGLGRTGNLWGAETYDFTPRHPGHLQGAHLRLRADGGRASLA